jgi:hypothetical protein
MAIPEACGLWIEQRVQEELDTKGETGASLREIGRTVAAEVEKYFETKVNPETIKSRALRMQAGSNEPPPKPTETKTETPHSNVIKHPAKDGTNRGGARPNAGRKVSHCDRLHSISMSQSADLSNMNPAVSESCSGIMTFLNIDPPI